MKPLTITLLLIVTLGGCHMPADYYGHWVKNKVTGQRGFCVYQRGILPGHVGVRLKEYTEAIEWEPVEIDIDD